MIFRSEDTNELTCLQISASPASSKETEQGTRTLNPAAARPREKLVAWWSLKWAGGRRTVQDSLYETEKESDEKRGGEPCQVSSADLSPALPRAPKAPRSAGMPGRQGAKLQDAPYQPAHWK